MAWGGRRLPPPGPFRGGSLRRFPLPLVTGRSHESRTCRSSPMGGGDFRLQRAAERRKRRVNQRMRFDNPMLAELRHRRFRFDGRGGRVESRWSGVSGLLHLQPATRTHFHRHMVSYAPRFVRTLHLSRMYPVTLVRTAGRTRIDQRISREPGALETRERIDRARPGTIPVGLVENGAAIRVRDLAASMVERMITRRQRIETARDSSAVMRERRNAVVDVERAVERVLTRTSESLTGELSTATTRDPHFGGSGPAPDIDRLTDQIVDRIDQRLLAHRERMGTVFQ